MRKIFCLFLVLFVVVSLASFVFASEAFVFSRSDYDFIYDGDLPLVCTF